MVDTEHFLKFCLFLSAKHKKTEILKKICKLMEEHLDIMKIKEILNFKTQDGLFCKSLMNYCNENMDMESCMVLLQLEHDINMKACMVRGINHYNGKVGLKQIRNQHPDGPLSNWIITTYSQLFPGKTSKLMALIEVVFVIGLLSYGLYAVDIVSDLQLYQEYSNYSDYNNSLFVVGKPNSQKSAKLDICPKNNLLDPDRMHASYDSASKTTYWLLVSSLIVYVLNILIGKRPAELLKCGKFPRSISIACNLLLMLPLMPFIHMIYSFRHLVSTQKTKYQEKVNKFGVLLKVIKIWEGFENSAQLLLSLWVARHFTLCLLDMEYINVLNHGFQGLRGIITFGYIKTDLIQILLGKLILTVFSSFFSLALMRIDKPGIPIKEKIVNTIFLFITFTIQCSTRLCAFYSLIFLRLHGSDIIYPVFAVHFVLTLIIVILFEKSFPTIIMRINLRTHGKPTWLKTLIWFKTTVEITIQTIIRVLSSFLVLQSDPYKNDVTNTFVSQSLFQILCLMENTTVVLIMHYCPELYPSTINDRTNTTSLLCIVIIGWIVAVVLQVCTIYFIKIT